MNLAASMRLRQVAIVGVALLLGLLAAASVSFAPAYLAFAALAALMLGVAMLCNPRVALLAAFGVIALLPFGTLPVKIAFTPTLLEIALLALAAARLLHVLSRSEVDSNFDAVSPAILRLSPLGGLVFVFLGLSLFSFLIGSGGSPSTLTLHNYAKLVLGVLLFFGVLNLVHDRHSASWALRALILGGTAAALIGLVLYALPDQIALKILQMLGPLGYPTSGRVLRYVEDDPNGLERAIGTSVDPNAFGGLLALTAVLALSQAMSQGPVLPRRMLWSSFGLMAVVVILTYSRAALGGLVIAALFLATVRYRRLWWLFVLCGIATVVVIVLLDRGDAFVERVGEGLRFEDQANQMRLNEYRNALRIIREYPVFGVGFGSAPSIDLTTGVSSIYLTIAERMGLVGLSIFLITMALFFVFTADVVRLARHDPASDWLLGIQGAILAALAVGVLDHYYFNIEFSHMVALFWGVVGLGMALRQIIIDNRTEVGTEPGAA